MVISNQKGAVDLLLTLLCIILLGLATLYTFKRVQQWQHMKEHFKQILCLKKYHNQTLKLLYNINFLNRIIISENILQAASVFFPVTWLASVNIEKVKKATKALQQLKLNQYQAEVSKLLINKCKINPISLKTPYLLKSGVLLKRDHFGQAKLRAQEFKVCHLLSFQYFCSVFNTKSRTQMHTDYKTQTTYFPMRL